MSRPSREIVLDPDNVLGYLRERGVLRADEPARAERMSGGVSNEVLTVSGESVDVVVKQALERLRVQEEWLADPSRILAEADALVLVGELTPDDIPPVIDVDRENLILTIARAPRDWKNWKTELLAGRASEAVAVRLGEALARWHSATAGRPELSSRFDQDHFRELRISPYYLWSAGCNPEVSAAIGELADSLLAPGRCLVHGDFSPKNVLTDGDAAWVLDWEVAHYGHPVFDVAFLSSHLLLKSIHRPERATAYHRCAEAFLGSYRHALSPTLHLDDRELALHTACLLLARVDGKSPVEYLGPEGQDRVRSLAIDTLTRSDSAIETLWENSAQQYGY
ncbi:aminoglycoside phosphotransferase family protein [Leifsonia bigeumensis]|uniref:Aminoglycoside phosphotransferase family protein n=1 Tax=Leifsonella bigeumensis TaxID=433643 RepID=A0ABP7F657_9MICO